MDSSSDESSKTIPSTPGQATLADSLAEFFGALGATITRDKSANVIAKFAGRGSLAGAEPLAFLVHVDTARGTSPVESLTVVKKWNGERLAFSDNADIEVSVANYPVLGQYVDQDVVHGPGSAPFGLDDKLGLAHMMTLAWLLAENPDIPHADLYLIGRPDEEIGRMEALIELASFLRERGVRTGYTIDGIEPFEVNVENFNAAQASIYFEATLADLPFDGLLIGVEIGGVNTHGATAKAERHRPATRLAAEVLGRLRARGFGSDDCQPVSFHSDELRDCDARTAWLVRDESVQNALQEEVAAAMAEHIPRGASYRFVEADGTAAHGATAAALWFVTEFLASDDVYPIAAENSEGRQGYSQPYRIVLDGDRLRLDVRLRDFDDEGLTRRKHHVQAMVAGFAAETSTVAALTLNDQYVNMGPSLADRGDLVTRAKLAADAIGVAVRVLPIRGGTGVDPFLDKGVAIANLGTGYFAPESEKELTSLQMMAKHALWLTALVQTPPG
jgi:tripeptide aminopeptidase